MSYALGQAKWIPGQISFMNAPEGRLPSVQPLIEAGLPYAPYIEHGSWVTGQPDIARYGRDPYRGIMGIGDSGDGLGQVTDRMEQAVTETVTGTIAAALPPMALIGTGVAVGSLAGTVGGLLGKSLLGGLLGAVGGGVVGYLAYKTLKPTVAVSKVERATVSGLDGMLAVL